MIATTGLKGLRIDCVVGVYAFERERTQPIVMNIELDYDIAAPAQSDAVAEAVDYDGVATVVTELIQRRQYRLIETMAEETAAVLFEHHGSVQTVRLEIRKPEAVPAAECSFVRLKRTRG